MSSELERRPMSVRRHPLAREARRIKRLLSPHLKANMRRAAADRDNPDHATARLWLVNKGIA